ncbi:MAG: hypothetical protein NTY88_05190 [Bacteroidetes bacterium]|nr:hypothetical protein [Bacteroidota bacterium]
MRKIISIAILTLLLSSCRIQAPVFKGIENSKSETSATGNIQLSAEVVFHNPNFMRCKMSDMAVDVTVNKKTVTTLGDKTTMMMKPKADFRIPVRIAIGNEGGILENIKSLFSLFSAKEVELGLEGNMLIKSFCFKKTIPIHYAQKINLSGFKK